jgi:gas vesicle protein
MAGDLQDRPQIEIQKPGEDDSAGLMWFLAGAAVGVAAALLYAPASGETVRKYISDKAQQSRTALTDTGQELIERGRDLYERGRKLADDAAEMFERGKQIVDKAAEVVEHFRS